MSWSLTLNGHKDQVDEVVLDELARQVTDNAREADIGLSYVSLMDSRGSRSIPLQAPEEDADDDT